MPVVMMMSVVMMVMVMMSNVAATAMAIWIRCSFGRNSHHRQNQRYRHDYSLIFGDTTHFICFCETTFANVFRELFTDKHYKSLMMAGPIETPFTNFFCQLFSNTVHGSLHRQLEDNLILRIPKMFSLKALGNFPFIDSYRARFLHVGEKHLVRDLSPSR